MINGNETPPPKTKRRIWIKRLAVFTCLVIFTGILSLPLCAGFYGRTLLRRCHPAEALDYLAIALKFHPWWVQAQSDACSAARQTGNHQLAWNHLEKLEERLGGIAPECILHWEMIHASMGDLQTVEVDLLDRWRRGGPESHEIACALVEGYIRMFRLPDALALTGDWLDREPGSLKVLLLRAQTWHRSHSPDNAVESLQEVVAIDPTQSECRLQLALSLLDKARYDEALKHLNFLSEKGKMDGLIESRRARCLHMIGREAQARTLLEKALQTLSDDYRLYSTLGQIELLTGHNEEAEAAFKKTLSIQETDYLANFSLSQALKRQGKNEESKAFLDRAEKIKTTLERLNEITSTTISQRPLDAALHRELGDIFTFLGQTESAKRWLMSAKRLDPNSPGQTLP
ncbi:MAG: tetratricopeptide repeat protein [Gemmataceae bacterium]